MNAERARLERMLRGREPLFGLGSLLGMRFVALAEGRAEVEMPIDGRWDNPAGATHGGVLFTLLDTCMGFAATSLLAPGERTLMVDASVSFVRAPGRGRLRGVGRVVRRGRQVLHVEAEARDARGVLVARSMGTALVVAGGATGRGERGLGRKPRAGAASRGTARGSRRVRAR